MSAIPRVRRPAIDAAAWPELPLAAWEDTYLTLHRWTQVVGKIRLALAPFQNHWWHIPLYVSARGLTTSAIPYGARDFQIDFDFVDHALRIDASDGARRSFALGRYSVAHFYRQTMDALRELGIAVDIWPVPVEMAERTPFDQDAAHASYDPEYAWRCWQILLQTDRVLKEYGSSFRGKVSPVHFFWGGFDLAATRFSGRRAPAHPGSPNVARRVMVEAYSHEVASCGFWPGLGLGEPAFYAYAYPEPPGYRVQPVSPSAAYYNADIGEFLLPYEAVRTAEVPDEALHAFLQSTYEAAANQAGWDRSALERRGKMEPQRRTEEELKEGLAARPGDGLGHCATPARLGGSNS
jgi:hypothetical protein